MYVMCCVCCCMCRVSRVQCYSVCCVVSLSGGVVCFRVLCGVVWHVSRVLHFGVQCGVFSVV